MVKLSILDNLFLRGGKQSNEKVQKEMFKFFNWPANPSNSQNAASLMFDPLKFKVIRFGSFKEPPAFISPVSCRLLKFMQVRREPDFLNILRR